MYNPDEHTSPAGAPNAGATPAGPGTPHAASHTGPHAAPHASPHDAAIGLHHGGATAHHKEFSLKWSVYFYILGEAKGFNAKMIRTLVVIHIVAHVLLFWISWGHSFKFAILENIALGNTILCLIHTIETPCSLSLQQASRLFDPKHIILTFFIVVVTGPQALLELIEHKDHCDNDPTAILLCRRRDVSNPTQTCIPAASNTCPTAVSKGYFNFVFGLMVCFVLYQWVAAILLTVFHIRFRAEHTRHHRKVLNEQAASRQMAQQMHHESKEASATARVKSGIGALGFRRRNLQAVGGEESVPLTAPGNPNPRMSSYEDDTYTGHL